MSAHQADVRDIERQAAILVGRAEALGVVLRITGEPLRPLAMGNQRHVIDARPARSLAPETVWPFQTRGKGPAGPVKQALTGEL